MYFHYTFLDLTPRVGYTQAGGMIMERKIASRLVKWRDQETERLPLVLQGARQVGKTYALRELGERWYKHTLYANFEQTPDLRSLFETDLSPERIIRGLEIFSGKPVIPGETLVILDEIQACDKALTSLKYFAESAPEFHVAAAGSLLGVAVNRKAVSFPVGKAQIEKLHPLDFEEFLWAQAKKVLADEIRAAFEANSALPDLLHNQALDQYRNYLHVGGMPAAVAAFVRKQPVDEIAKIHHDILTAYVADMAKYASPSDTVKIRAAFDSIPAQLAKENRKFQYKVITKGGRSSQFGPAIDWLLASGLVSACHRVSEGHMPPSAYADLSAFKLYAGDTGLLVTKSGIPPRTILLDQPLGAGFKGGLAENYVAQALTAAGYDLHYWESNQTAEVDFIIVREGAVVPVEVKSADNIKSRSLSVYVGKYHPPYSIRLSAKNFGFENAIRSVPLYAAFALAPSPE